MKKILIVLTNVEKYKTSDIPTGLWLGELIHFYDEIKKHGFEADFVSPKGGYVPIDPYSMRFMDKVDYKWYSNKDFVKNALFNTLKPSDVKPKDYIAIYYTGGHGVLWDFPDNKEIQEIAMQIYNFGGYITAVCHGVVGLLNLKKIDGNFLIKERTVTGFTDTEELISLKKIRYLFLQKRKLKLEVQNSSKKDSLVHMQLAIKELLLDKILGHQEKQQNY